MLLKGCADSRKVKILLHCSIVKKSTPASTRVSRVTVQATAVARKDDCPASRVLKGEALSASTSSDPAYKDGQKRSGETISLTNLFPHVRGRGRSIV